MSNRIKQKAKSAVPMTETQKHIKELREKLNKTDPNEIRPFTVYKILTYLCVLILRWFLWHCFVFGVPKQ